MENKNVKENELKKEQQIELDSDFMKELNQVSKQLKTDEEIIYGYKPEYSKQNYGGDKTKTENKLEQNMIYDLNKDMNNLNLIELLINQNTNDNPFKEAYNIMNLKENNFSLNNNDLIFESLDILNANVHQFNDILYKIVDLNGNSKKKNDKNNNILGEILNFLIQSNLLKNTILNMKISIEESFEKNKNNLKKEENQKYQEALKNAETIIKEINKVDPDKSKIMDCLFKLQKISNDIDSISLI
jgi:hypothetical protein